MNTLDKILKDIGEHRFFKFTDNYSAVVFDSKTGLLWSPKQEFTGSDDQEEYATPPAIIDDFTGWRLPTKDELVELDNASPPSLYDFRNGYKVIYDGKIKYLDYDYRVKDNYDSYFSLYCAYCSNILASQNLTSPIDILALFKGMNFNAVYYYDHYGNVYWNLLDISFPDTPEENTAAINKSPIKYYKAVLNLTDAALQFWRSYGKIMGLDKISQATDSLGNEYFDNSNLTSEENALMAARQKFVAEHFAFSTSDVTAQLLSFKSQAEILAARIDEINRGENSISELAELERTPRVSFEFLVENVNELILDGQRRARFFESNKDFSNMAVTYHKAWNESYIDFKTNQRGEFERICDENSIDKEIYSAWYDDWQHLRFKIEEKFLPLIEFALKAALPADSLKNTLEVLQTYKNDIDEFYLHERKNIHQKFAFQSGGDLQEKFETESHLYKFIEKLQRGLQEIMFAQENSDVRIFLLKWAESLINLPIDAITEFVKANQLDAISAEVLNKFVALKRQNFNEYLKDSQAYGEALQKRDSEYNALIFKMRKDLNRKQG